MNTMHSQVKVVAYLHILLGAICLLGAAGLALLFGVIGAAIGGGVTGHGGVGLLGFLGVGGIAFVLVGIFAIPHFIVAWGLLNGAEWARIAGIIVSILSLVHPAIGLGTAIAIYSLIVLFSTETEELFRRSS